MMEMKEDIATTDMALTDEKSYLQKWLVHLELDIDRLFNQSFMKDEDEKLINKIEEIVRKIKRKLDKIKFFLGIENKDLFFRSKDKAIRFLNKQKDKLLLEKFKDGEKEAVRYFLRVILMTLRKCSPPTKIETNRNREENIAKEQELREQQKAFNEDRNMLDKLRLLKKEKLKQGLKVYLMYVWPDEEYRQREDWIQSEFVPLLDHHLRWAGIDLIWDKGRNFTGSNLLQFMNRLTASDYVLILGTESFRKKLLSSPTAIHFEEKLLELKWLLALSEGHIDEKRTSIIPYVLTGIRQTAFPDKLGSITVMNETIRSLSTLGYKNAFTDILCQVYEVRKNKLFVFKNRITGRTLQLSTRGDKEKSKVLDGYPRTFAERRSEVTIKTEKHVRKEFEKKYFDSSKSAIIEEKSLISDKTHKLSHKNNAPMKETHSGSSHFSFLNRPRALRMISIEESETSNDKEAKIYTNSKKNNDSLVRLENSNENVNKILDSINNEIKQMSIIIARLKELEMESMTYNSTLTS